MEPFAMYRLPLRSLNVRGKSYNIIALEEADKWGTIKCHNKCLLSSSTTLDIIFISNSSKPCSRLMWRTINCLIIDKGLQYLPYNILYQKERYRRPVPMDFPTSGKDLIELKLSKKDLLKTKGIESYHSITIPNALYKKLKEVEQCSPKRKRNLKKR